MAVRLMLAGLFALTALAQNTTQTSRKTVIAPATISPQLFVPPDLLGNGFAGSVLGADGCGTTIGIACTEGFANPSKTWVCNPESTVYATYNANHFAVSTQYTIDSAVATTIQTCHFHGTTRAICSITYGASVSGKSTSSTTVRTMTGSHARFQQVAITAGADKFDSGGAKPAVCTALSDAAVIVGSNPICKILIVPVAAFLLGLGLL